MKLPTIFFCIVTLLLIVGCDPHDSKLTIVNNTNDTIFYSFSYDNDSISYPINQNTGDYNDNNAYVIQPKSENHESVMDTWEYFINTKCKDSVLRVFFFNDTLIKTVSKDSIMKHQLSSQAFKLKVKDLEELNWHVVYNVK